MADDRRSADAGAHGDTDPGADADEDADADADDERHTSGEREDDAREGFAGIRFVPPPISPPPISLPPVSLPPLFPEGFRLVFLRPGFPGVRPGPAGVLTSAVLLDAVDAVLALAGPPDLVLPRVLTGTAVAVVLYGPLGAAYLWELALAGVAPAATAAPSLSLLGLLWRVERLRRGHPEDFDGGAEREREPPDEQQ